MNCQQLGVIEKRWAESSGGRWSTFSEGLLPYHERGKVMSTKEAVERFHKATTVPAVGGDRKVHKLESFTIKNYQDAVTSNYVTGPDDWIKRVDEEWPHIDEERISQNCRLIFPISAARVDAELKRDLKGDGAPLTLPVLAVLGSEQGGHCSAEDLHFILHASEDVGTLISEVQKSDGKVAHLTAALKEAQAEAVTARADRDAALSAVARAREASKQLLDITSSKSQPQEANHR